MTRPAKAIFFDLGETLVTQNIEDSMVTRHALQAISKILPKQISPAELFKLYMRGYKTNDAIRSEYNVEIPIEAWMRQLLSRVLGSEPEDSLVDKCIDTIVKHRAENAIAFDDAWETLRSLRKRKVTLGVISNVSSHKVALSILRKVDLLKYFDLVTTSALTGIRKPDPGIFRYAVNRLNISPEDAVIVGDSERHDIRGGHSAGFTTMLVNRKGSESDSIADYRFRTLGEAARTLQTI
ncbi:HAD family hydrolase [Candidatus Bathyarchaeota archaeon]|nr:HAD family hydrolase [Candidatus Bathyarchaeota archaeon]